MNDGNDPVSLTYDHDLSALPALRLGYKHQEYENFERYMHQDWRGWFYRAYWDMSVAAGIVAALAAVAVFMFTPGMRMPGYWPFLLLALASGGTVWLLLRSSTGKLRDSYAEAFLISSIRMEMERAKTVNMKIGPEGLTAETATDTMFLGWPRYHCAVVEPEHLVLVFEGPVYAIPNAALPVAPADLAHKINGWVEAAARAN